MAVHPLVRKGYTIEPCRRCGAGKNLMCEMYNARVGAVIATNFMHVGRKATVA